MPYNAEKLQSIVGKITWQNAAQEVALTNSLRNFAKSEFSVENIKFLTDKSKPEDCYKKYISPKSSTQVNLPSSMQDAMDKLAKDNDFANKEWPNLIKKAKAEVENLITRDTIPRYLKSPQFKIYCAQNPDFKKHCLAAVQKPAKVLGIKNVKLLAEIAGCVALGDMDEAGKLSKKLEAEEKVKEILKALKAAGLA